MSSKLTIFQRLNKILSNGNTVVNANIEPKPSDDGVILKTTDKDEYDMKRLQANQQHLLAKQWRKAQYDISNKELSNLNQIKLMYRDADIMDDFPEIGTALDIVMEESTYINDTGFMINITSKSERVKSILQDLFVNRLSINTVLPMICRSTCKYGNTFMLLNIDENNGIIGWKQLPVYEMERFENGMDNPYSNAYTNLNTINVNKDMSTKFVWVGANDFIPYMNWQIAHFRLLYNSLFLPYGMSFLNKARRHFRMLSMMEDMMLIYRLERSIERRVFKINVGAIDEADVPSYVQQIADNFKRTPIVDPMTGQIDLRKNIMNQQEDFFIPVRDSSEPSPIETLPAAQNLTAMDDVKYVQNKVLTALRVPKSFLNFEEAQGDGKNLSLLDVRFARTVNRIQQSLIMELNKVAMIHLLLLGFTDDITNFNITMNNPSSQAEMLELENMAKKVTTAKDAITDGGNGIPLMSVTRAWKSILKWSDKEISDNLEELRLEKALAAELERTSQIIKKTGIFDPVDNIYGEPGAEYSDNQQGEEGQDGGPDGGMGGGGGMPSMGGGDVDFGDEGEMAEGGPEVGAEGEMPMEDAANNETGNLGEHYMRGLLNRIDEKKKITNERLKDKSSRYIAMLNKKLMEETKENNGEPNKNIELYNKAFTINEELNTLSKQLNGIVLSE